MVEVTNRDEHNSYFSTYDNNEENELEVYKIPFGNRVPTYLFFQVALRIT